jgi:hypothetical protein
MKLEAGAEEIGQTVIKVGLRSGTDLIRHKRQSEATTCWRRP